MSGAAHTSSIPSTTRRPRRRRAAASRDSAASAGMPLEVKSHIEHDAQRCEREPLERITAMPIHTHVGPVPFTDQTVVEVVGLLDHHRLQRELGPRAIAFESEVLPYPALWRLGLQLVKLLARDDCDALDRALTCGRSHYRKLVTRPPRGDPAPIHQNVHAAATDAQGRDDVIAHPSSVHFVVEQNRIAVDILAACRY